VPGEALLIVGVGRRATDGTPSLGPLANRQLARGQQSLSSPNSAGAALAPAPEVLAGEIAAAKGDYARAIAHLETAVRLD
jgi:hypothetical protein